MHILNQDETFLREPVVPLILNLIACLINGLAQVTVRPVLDENSSTVKSIDGCFY